MTKVLFLIGLSVFLLIFGKSQTNAEFSPDSTKVTDVTYITEGQVPIDSPARKLMIKIAENKLLRERRAGAKKDKLIKNENKKIIKNEKKGNNFFVRKDKKKKSMKKKRKEKRRKEKKSKKKKRKYKKNKGKKMKSKRRKQAKKHRNKKTNEKKRKYDKKNKAKKKENNKIKQVKKHKNNEKRDMLSKQYRCENDLSRVGKLFKRFGVLYRREKNQIVKQLVVMGGKKERNKTEGYKEGAEKIRDAVIYPFQPRCTKNITKEGRQKISDTYVNLLSCESKIIKVCDNETTNITRMADESCSADALNKITDSISTCFDDGNCLQTVNIEQLETLYKKCNAIITQNVAKEAKTLKKECTNVVKDCKNRLSESVKVLEKCVGGKPDNNTKPKHSEVVNIRKVMMSRQSNLKVQKMDIAEHGQIFTQTSTYDEDKNILKIHVPEHGHGIHTIKESITYLITQFNDKTIFDTEIMTVGKISYISNVAIDIPTATNFLERDYNISNGNDSVQDIPIEDTETIDSNVTKIDKKARAQLGSLVQGLTTDSLEVITISKQPITANDRIKLHAGGTFKTNHTGTGPKTTTASPCVMTTKHLRFRKGKFSRTNPQAFSREDCTGSTDTYYIEVEGSTCRYILKKGDGPDAETQEILDHGVHTHARNVLCCMDESKFANPGFCQCSFIDQRYTTNFDKCRMASQSTKKCCDVCNYQGVGYTLVGVTGLGEYGCRDNCLYQNPANGKRRCFSPEEQPNCSDC